LDLHRWFSSAVTLRRQPWRDRSAAIIRSTTG
jgi:hypothetical protein